MSFLNCVFPFSLRCFHAVIALGLLLVLSPAQAAAPLVLHSKAVLVVNQRTGKTLFQRQANRALPIASLTKLILSWIKLRNAPIKKY
ncbi:hypothetical protein [Serratia inhibens]|uniref:hypothetical protein n=1 Tax=Serratia inhibens TaxID=2338073 RepID=UPI001FD58672|nr:hypothetical protein [Serratia inhibens]